MSEHSTSQVDDEVRDPWEVGLSIPSISFADHRVGEGFSDAIIVPIQIPGKYFGLGYEIQKKTKQVTDPETKQRSLVIERWPDGKPKPQTVLTLLTGLGVGEFMSDQAITRFKTAAESGDDELLGFINKVKQFGLRRLFVTGGSLDPEFRAAVRGAGDGKPQPCAYVSVEIVKMEPNEHPGGRTKFYKVQYRQADQTSRDKVAQYLATGAVIETGKRDETDPWADDRSTKPAAGNGFSAPKSTPALGGEEPPF